MSNLIKTSIKWLAAARWSLGPLSALTETLSTDPEEGLACAAMGSPHYPESKMHLRCTASGRTPLGPGLFHLAHRRMPTRNSLSAEWWPRAPRPPLWTLYTKILHPDLAPTAFCFTPVSLEPVIAWHLQLRAFEGTASARDMRHIHLCWGLSFFPQNQAPLRDMETSYSPSPSSRRGRGIQSQIKAICHASSPKHQGQSTPHFHAACPASSDSVQLGSGNRLSLFLSTAKETGKSLSRFLTLVRGLWNRTGSSQLLLLGSRISYPESSLYENKFQILPSWMQELKQAPNRGAKVHEGIGYGGSSFKDCLLPNIWGLEIAFGTA